MNCKGKKSPELEAHGCANEAVAINVALLGFVPLLSSCASYTLRSFRLFRRNQKAVSLSEAINALWV